MRTFKMAFRRSINQYRKISRWNIFLSNHSTFSQNPYDPSHIVKTPSPPYDKPSQNLTSKLNLGDVAWTEKQHMQGQYTDYLKPDDHQWKLSPF